MSKDVGPCESPVEFYRRVVGEGDLRRWDGSGINVLLQSFEKSYSGYLRRFPSYAGSVEQNDGLGALYGSGSVRALGVGVCSANGGDSSESTGEDTGGVHGEQSSVNRSSEVLGPNGGKSYGRGKNYVRNQQGRLRKKHGNVVPEWRQKKPVEVVSSDSGYSSVGAARGRCETVCSEALSTAEQRARETLALRRVAENRVAIAKAEALVASYADSAKSEALQELSALRIAQRANEARAKSQSSWKKCEESLGSLGSTGSAGEFWMKKEVEKGRKLEKRYQQLKKQSEHMYANVTQQVRDELLAMDGTVSDEDEDCAEGLEDLDEYLAQKVEAGGKSLAAMEEEFRNFKF